MATTRGTFILTEAAQMLPLVRRILHDLREARSRLCQINRRLRQTALSEDRDAIDPEREALVAERRLWREKLADCLAEAGFLGIEITSGVRCEALFPFEHQWIGPNGDGKLRPAYFVYNDAQNSITEWFFSGWPNDRRKVNPRWWRQFRPAPARRLQTKVQIKRQPA